MSFDVNYRASLWSPDAARATLATIIPQVDVLFAGPAEAALIVHREAREPDGDPWTIGRELAARLTELAPTHVVVKLGEHGALSLRDGAVEEVPAYPVDVVDTVGAGDAFVGGHLAALVSGRSTKDCLETGARLGALVCGARGDWEGLLDWEGPEPTRVGADVVR